VRHADDPPRQAFAGEEIGLGILGGLLRHPPADGDHQQEVENDYQQVERMHAG